MYTKSRSIFKLNYRKMITPRYDFYYLFALKLGVQCCETSGSFFLFLFFLKITISDLFNK